MREFGFELRLCARLEAEDRLVARQLGAGVRRPAGRVVDVLVVEPGPGFDERRALTPREIPDLAIEADVGVGRARPRREVIGDLDVRPETAREATERAVAVGFLERVRRGGRELLRQAARYPEDWFDRLVAIENKPDLGRPGDLADQLRTDVSLGLVDAVVLATESHVTGAHLHRLPDAVGVWRVRETAVEVLREPEPLPVGEPGVEIVGRRPGRTDVRVVGTDAKARRRRRLAERAYGKGWRTYAMPGCANARAAELAGVGGLPDCAHHGRLVDPASECGPACPGREPADPPAVDLAAARDRASPWVADPPGAARSQGRLDRFG